jgi:hypothetical protein
MSSAETPRIVVYASDGSRVAEFDGPGTLRPVSPQHLDARLEWLVKRANEGHEEATRRIHENAVHTDHLPYYHALVVDPWGHLWLQEYEPPWGPGPRWYVLSQAGQHLADIVMPKELTVHAISEDDILAGTVGEYDEERIEVLPWITKPSRAASPLPQCEA